MRKISHHYDKSSKLKSSVNLLLICKYMKWLFMDVNILGNHGSPSSLYKIQASDGNQY
ncbi:MAG: hypothetical protein ACRDE8_17655 [Ginsengibacter sp.]